MRPQMRPFGEPPKISLAELQRMTIGIVEKMLASAMPTREQAVIGECRATRRRAADGLEKTVGMLQDEIGEYFSAIDRAQLQRGSTRLKHTHAKHPIGIAMGTEQGERITVAGGTQQFEIVRGERHETQRRGCTRQMRRAYSPMARSEEKTPMPATLRIAAAAQASRSRYKASTRCCAATYSA